MAKDKKVKTCNSRELIEFEVLKDGIRILDLSKLDINIVSVGGVQKLLIKPILNTADYSVSTTHLPVILDDELVGTCDKGAACCKSSPVL